MALLAAVYGFRPWDVARLTPQQIEMYLEQSGSIRLMQALPQLQANFGKLDEEARLKLIAEAGKSHDPTTVDARAWKIFVRNYQTDREEVEKVQQAEALTISAGAATALVAMIESGELTRDFAMGSLMWRTRIMSRWHGLLAAAQ